MLEKAYNRASDAAEQFMNQGYRSDKAMHVKLDAVDPNPERNNLETRTAREIDELRDDMKG